MSATAIVAEDEATLRQQLVEQLGQLWPELTVVAEAADGVAALRLLAEHRPDVLFLDIQMPGATGLELLLSLSLRWGADQGLGLAQSLQADEDALAEQLWRNTLDALHLDI